MPRLLALLAATLLVLLVVACGQSAPPPAPTAAKPAAPTAAPAAAPTKAPAAAATAAPAAATKAPAAPTAAPAAKVDFPAKNKSIQMTIGYAAGGSNDIGARILAVPMEKILGVPVEIVNKAGAGTQVQRTELANAKPDGYTIGQDSLPTNIILYLDPNRKATFSAKSYELIGTYAAAPVAVAVKADGPYKTLKDLVDAAKAAPRKVQIADTAILGGPHLGVVWLSKAAGVEFASVHYDGGAQTTAAVLGGHNAAAVGQVTVFLPQVKSGEMRLVAVMDDQRNEFVPDVPTVNEQGWKVTSVMWHGLTTPAGVPKPIIGVLHDAMKKALDDAELKKRMSDAGLSIRYSSSEQYAKIWADMEANLKPVIEEETKKSPAK